ncbi:NADH-quinone oxidoreductase subunit C [Actinomadura rupiterrae]|uniref:NADH-quinone oxidoreductase subunit C n=1 Tax=Actinomadura rupiterrae TaxID=559627 RepID=UPI0020A5BC80|nr:NADH-quinone oxidoreductase subunit C [Actinomadura rupiterrae]MCP2343448.1 NADH-quinone oxidoreductase subunit C [Actinomadura rupiterrae]
MSSQNPEQQAEQAADRLPAHREDERAEQPVARTGMFGIQGTGDTSGYGRLVVRQAPKVSSPRPFGGPDGAAEAGEFDEIADQLARLLPTYGEAVERVVVHRGELTLHVKREHLAEVARTLRDAPELRFEMCMGVSGVHYPSDEGAELHAVYPLLSITHNRRVRLDVSCPDSDPHVPSIVDIYPTNDWHERETYDFFGIVFDGHPALTRIMMPDDWVGHPQRKDYPLGGIPVEYRGAEVPPPDQRRSYT